MSSSLTSRIHRYRLKVVSNGQFVFVYTLQAARSGPPVLNFAAKPMAENDAPAFWGGPRLDRVIEEGGNAGIDLFPMRAD